MGTALPTVPASKTGQANTTQYLATTTATAALLLRHPLRLLLLLLSLYQRTVSPSQNCTGQPSTALTMCCPSSPPV
jgi:hypothetical protein